MTKYHVLGGYEQWKFTSHSCGGWKSKIKAPEWPCSLEGPSFWFSAGAFSLCLQMGEGIGISLELLLHSTKPNQDDSTLITLSISPKPHL